MTFTDRSKSTFFNNTVSRLKYLFMRSCSETFLGKAAPLGVQGVYMRWPPFAVDGVDDGIGDPSFV